MTKAEEVIHLMETEYLWPEEACRRLEYPPSSFQRHYKQEGLVEEYARAREAVHRKIAQDIIDISNEVQGQIVDEDGNVRLDSGWQQRQKLRIDSLKWLLSKMNPGQYGDRIQQEVNADVKTSSKSIDWSKVPDDALEAIIKSQKKNDK